MGNLNSIVSVSITATTKTPTRTGFGVGMLAAYHTAYLDKIRTYSSYAAVIADFAATTVIARAAAKYFGQDPAPKKLKIGRRATVHTQKFKLTPTDTTVGRKYTMDFVTPAGVASHVEYVVVSMDTVATIIDGLIIALGTASPAVAMTPTDNATDFDLVVSTPGQLFDLVVNKEMDIKNTTADPGLAADLAAISVVDSDWYGLALDSNSKAEGLVAALYANANGKIFSTDSYDSEIKKGTASNYALSLKTLGYTDTHLLWSGSILSFGGMAELGRMLPFKPGTADWMFKDLQGVAVDVLTDTEVGFLEAANASYYTEVGGLNIVQPGKSSGGQFMDITIIIDQRTADIRTNVYATIALPPIFPYTDDSVSVIKGVIASTLKGPGIDPKSIDVQAPRVADASVTDRGNRHLPDVTFTATVTGAVHSVDIAGILSV